MQFQTPPDTDTPSIHDRGDTWSAWQPGCMDVFRKILMQTSSVTKVTPGQPGQPGQPGCLDK